MQCPPATAPRRRNTGPRGVARFYRQQCGWRRNEIKAITGKKPPPATPRRALTPEQQRTFARAVADLGRSAREMSFLLQLLPLTGLRVSEVVRLQRKHVIDHRAAESGHALRVFGKGSKWRTVPLTRTAWEALAGYLRVGPRRQEDFLFPGLGAAGHVTAPTVEAACRRIGKAYPSLAALTPHVLRHTYATNALAACVHPRALQAALGHDKFATTLVYLHTLGLTYRGQ